MRKDAILKPGKKFKVFGLVHFGDVIVRKAKIVEVQRYYGDSVIVVAYDDKSEPIAHTSKCKNVHYYTDGPFVKNLYFD